MKTLKWGTIGTGSIARAFAAGVQESPANEMVAVGSRTVESAEAFGEAFSIPSRHGSYEALLADPVVDAVYVCTPHPLHARWAVAAADVGSTSCVRNP